MNMLPNSRELDGEYGSPAERIDCFRSFIQRSSDVLHEQFQQGVDVSKLVHKRAKCIDIVLQKAWTQFMHSTPQPAFVAVGGYGRGELHPGSDIDLLIILPGEDDSQYRDEIEQLLTFLWDIGLEIGHSVRTLAECVAQARADITIATNLMEARLLAGPEQLFNAMREQTMPPSVWPSRDFFEAKWQEQIARHNRFDDTAYNLEPNIKEGPGGLRDIQMIGWVAKRHFNAETLHDLVKHHFLTEAEYRTLIAGQTLLWRIRTALHHLTGRREDRLLFDYQRELAEQFGYQDNTTLAVEQFMKAYYRTIAELSALNEMLLQLFQEAILYADSPREPVAINKRFQSHKGFIEVVHDGVFRRYPFALLEIFLLLAQHPELKGIRAETMRLMRAHLYLIDDNFRNDLRCRSLFIEFMRQPQGITHALRKMHEYGILGAYIPAFGKVMGQMQYDLFHVYTVDEHTIFVVRNLRRFATDEFAHEFPHCSALIRQIPKPEIVYLAGLFHDIAKGRGGDHSELGASDARKFCLHHEMSEYDANMVAWLVKQHLIMSRTSQREDISDPDVIQRFAGLIGNKDRLDYLYLLTVADMRATSPDAWNNWKGALLRELYENTKKALRRSLVSVDDAEKIAEIKQQVLQLLTGSDCEQQIEKYWREMSDDYFLRYTPDEIVWQMQSICSANRSLPIVEAREAPARGGSEIFIHSHMVDGQFAMITSVIDQLGLNIVDARIIRSKNGLTYDSYIVLDQDGEPIHYADDLKRVVEAIRQRMETLGEIEPVEVTRRPPRQHKHFDIPLQINFSKDQRFDQTIMEVISSDEPGLLADVGQALQQCNVRLHNARISTFGSRVEDLFYITDRNNQPLDEDSEQALEQAVISMLD
ncbi:MAG: [protein-PII] uridylyltransferase [Granulosicoccaceae bacterium]|jgi:[protein-PII] uridylyltransferase